MRDRFDAVIQASRSEQTQKRKIIRETTSSVVMDTLDNEAEETRKFKIPRETTSIVVMDTHDNKAVYSNRTTGFQFHKKDLGVAALNMGYFTVLENVILP